MKRIVDVSLGTVLLFATAPLTALAALASAVVLRRPPIFIQPRIGLAGRSFRILKIRTLRRDSDGTETTVPITAFLRRSHLDELPQLLQVVLGQMSLVGPRPETVPHAEQLDARFASIRTSVRPGCTGLWQISSAADRRIAEAPQYDLYYVKHASLGLDLWIVWTTVKVMLGGRRIELRDLESREGLAAVRTRQRT